MGVLENNGIFCKQQNGNPAYKTASQSLCMLVHVQVTVIFVVSVCLFVQSFSQPSLIRFGSN